MSGPFALRHVLTQSKSFPGAGRLPSRKAGAGAHPSINSTAATMSDMHMPTETAAGVALAAKYGLLAKLAALMGTGALGAVLIAAVDPAEAIPDPIKRRKLIVTQVIVALIVAGICGPLVTSWLGRPGGWFPVEPSWNLTAWLELAMPVGLFLGAMSWGFIGAAVKLRILIAERGAQLVADRFPELPKP